MDKRGITRRQLEESYDHLYRKPEQNFLVCYYCGDPSGCFDHCPPLSWVDSLGRGWFEDEKIEFVKIAACKECNNVLGAKKLFTPEARKKHLVTAMKRRYSKLLKMPQWQTGQVAELKGKLKRYVSKSVTTKEAILARIDHLTGAAACMPSAVSVQPVSLPSDIGNVSAPLSARTSTMQISAG